MRRAAIDFAPRRRMPGALTAGFFLAGMAVFSGAAWEYSVALAENHALERQVADARDSARRSGGRQPPIALPAPVIAAINEAIGQLNLPWGELFSAFEAELPKSVALLALEPDVRKQVFNVQAEAKTPEDMVDFYASLDAGQRFAEVSLLRHEVNEEDPNRPIRFVLQARWGGGGK